MSGSSPGDLLERAADLRREGRPFVLATVVRSLRPASAKPGDRALLVTGGQPIGWVGGGCVHTAIEREAAQAMADGAPRLVRLSPEPHQEDGVVSYPMTCHSGGTLDIYLEPVLPAPELVVLGGSPVAEALRALGVPLGFRVHNSLEDTRTADVWVVAAGMSSDVDQPAVRAALALGVPYVGLVASLRRRAALVDELRQEGVPEEAIGRLKSPAGLDIGATTGIEIALSILAEIVQRRRSRPIAAATPSTRATVVDPICGMDVDTATAKWTAERHGETYYFCAPGCRRTFLSASAAP